MMSQASKVCIAAAIVLERPLVERGKRIGRGLAFVSATRLPSDRVDKFIAFDQA